MLEEYSRIVREKAVKRGVITVAQELSEGLYADGMTSPAEQLATAKERISFLEQQVKATPGAKSKEKLRYPVIPADAWHPAAEIYRQAHTRASEASDNWHFICFYTGVGALLGRSVGTRMGRMIYPNIYSILVGLVGGDGKDTAIDYLVDFITSIDSEIYIPREIDSRASFIVNWEKFNNGLGQMNVGNARAILRMVEMRSLLDKAEQTATRSVVSMLNDAYDGPPKLSNESIQTPASVPKAHLSALMGTAWRWMRTMSEVDLVSGFGRRLVFAPGDPKDPIPEPDPPDVECLAQLTTVIRGALKFWREKENRLLRPSPQARAMWNDWYSRYKKRCRADDLIGPMSVGDRVTARKVALINAALDQSDEYIEEQHLAPALAFCEYLYQSRFPIFSTHGASPGLEVESKILEIVRKCNGRISKRTLQQSLPRVEAKVFNDHLRALSVADGPLRLDPGVGRALWVVLNEG